MRANNLLGITDGNVKRPMKITESNKNSGTIVKNQKDIENWNALDGWAMMLILSTSMKPALIEKHVTATSSYVLSYDLWSKLKAIYELKSEVSKKVLWDHFYGIIKISNETINQFVSRIVLAAQKLRNSSVTCNDE